MVPLTGSVSITHAAGLMKELLSSSQIVKYARGLWKTQEDRLSFYLDLQSSGRLAFITLTAGRSTVSPHTSVEALICVPPERLTFRELEVLTLVAAGHSNPEIAEHLGTRPRTVSTQVESLRIKLGASSRAALSSRAVQNGWLLLPLPAPTEECRALAISLLEREESQPTTPRVSQMGINLALSYPKSGPAADDGTESLHGARLAIEEINARGGVHGHLISPIEIDADIYSRSGLKRTFQQIREADVDAVMMSYVFDEAAAFEELAELDVPLLHTMTSQRQVLAAESDARKYTNIFQCSPSEVNYGSGLVRFIEFLEKESPELVGERTLSFLETEADAGQIADQTTIHALENIGWRVSSIDDISEDPVSATDTVEKVIELSPSITVVSEFLPSRLASVYLELLDKGFDGLIYAIYAPSIPAFRKLVQGKEEGLIWSTVSGTYGDQYGHEFITKYRERFRAVPGYSQAGLAYDMVNVLVSAWRSSNDSRDIPSTLDSLRNTRYRGVNGSYIFSPIHQTSLSYPDQTPDPSVGKAQLVFQVQDGDSRCIAPQPYVEAQLQVPPWMVKDTNDIR